MDHKLLTVRLLEVAFLLFNVVLVGIGAGLCVSTIEIHGPRIAPIAEKSSSGCISSHDLWLVLGRWFSDENKSLAAQAFVFFSTIALFLMIFCECFCVSCCEYQPECRCTPVIGVIVCLVNFCLEAWLTVGAPDPVAKIVEKATDHPHQSYNKPDEWQVIPKTVYTRFYVQSWAAATFFYLVLTALYALDVYLVCIAPKVPDAPELKNPSGILADSNKSKWDSDITADAPKSTKLQIETPVSLASTKSTDAPTIVDTPGSTTPSIKSTGSKKGSSKSVTLKTEPATRM